MAGDGTTVERLRQYLYELTPEARALLIAELERAVLRGDDVAGSELILHELRQLVRETRGLTPRLHSATRLFYAPIEPFLVDDIADHNHPNRIARASLTPIWNWIARELLPEEAQVYTDKAGDALLAGDSVRAQQLADALQDRAATAIEQAFASVAGDERAGRRLRSQIGTPRSEESATLIARILRWRAAFNDFSARLPLQIADLSGVRLVEIKTMIDSETAREPANFPCFLLIVMRRLAEPWQIIRFAVKQAGTDHSTRVAATSYAVAVNIVLAELARLVNELKSELRSGRGVGCGIILKNIHDAARGLRTELDISSESHWGRQLSQLRTQVSGLLKAEIESVPGRVRRLLRPRNAVDIRPGAVLNAEDVAETELLVDFAGACRNFASELAINEITLRAYNELQQYLDNTTRTLVDGLRHAEEAERPFRQSQVDAAVRFCGRVFGAEYAAMISRSAEAALAGEQARARV
ncbi:MAG: hypothetical protein AB7O50_09310 [Pseudolabrys sp.]